MTSESIIFRFIPSLTFRKRPTFPYTSLLFRYWKYCLPLLFSVFLGMNQTIAQKTLLQNPTGAGVGSRFPSTTGGTNFGAPSTSNSSARQPSVSGINRFGPNFVRSKKDSVVSIIPDSLAAKNSQFEQTVYYAADDSTLMFVADKKVLLYGNAFVSYGDIELKADFIQLSWGKNEVLAHGMPDSSRQVGERVKGKPIFVQGGAEYNSDTIRYNFTTKKALIKNIVTQQGEGIIQGRTVKKDSVDNLYLVDARYSTCNLKDPHFHIAARKIKLIDKKSII